MAATHKGYAGDDDAKWLIMKSMRPDVINNVLTEATRRPTRVPRQRPVRGILPRVVTMVAICVTVAGVRVYTVMTGRVAQPSKSNLSLEANGLPKSDATQGCTGPSDGSRFRYPQRAA